MKFSIFSLHTPRKIIEPQIQFGHVDISEITFDLRSRDEIPKLLMGLQYVYCTPEICEQVFKILEDMVPEGTDTNNGRPWYDMAELQLGL